MFKMLNKALQHALAGLTGVGPRRGNEKEKGGERGGKGGKGGERRGKEGKGGERKPHTPVLQTGRRH